MKLNWKRLLAALAIPLAVGGLSAYLTRGGVEAFEMVQKPPLTPPQSVFPVVWTALFLLMGVSSYIVYEKTSCTAKRDTLRRNTLRRDTLLPYALQLIFNFLWSLLFFNAQAYLFAFIWLVILWLLIIWMIVKFHDISPAAAYIQLPYLLWVTFAGYLNFMVYMLNG